MSLVFTEYSNLKMMSFAFGDLNPVPIYNPKAISRPQVACCSKFNTSLSLFYFNPREMYFIKLFFNSVFK